MGLMGKIEGNLRREKGKDFFLFATRDLVGISKGKEKKVRRESK